VDRLSSAISEAAVLRHNGAGETLLRPTGLSIRASHLLGSGGLFAGLALDFALDFLKRARDLVAYGGLPLVMGGGSFLWFADGACGRGVLLARFARCGRFARRLCRDHLQNSRLG